jgi:hypothetical protein
MCESDHDDLRHPESWRSLPIVGTQQFGDVRLELRNTPCCNSTLAKLLEEEDCDDQ